MGIDLQVIEPCVPVPLLDGANQSLRNSNRAPYLLLQRPEKLDPQDTFQTKSFLLLFFLPKKLMSWLTFNQKLIRLLIKGSCLH